MFCGIDVPVPFCYENVTLTAFQDSLWFSSPEAHEVWPMSCWYACIYPAIHITCLYMPTYLKFGDLFHRW